jgi:glucosamine-6-phosphate deaminase
MKVTVHAEAEQVGRQAGMLVSEAVAAKPALVLGVATGSSPIALYEDLAERVQDGRLDCSELTAFALDEYVGVPARDPRSYAAFIRTHVTLPLGLDAARVHVPDGNAVDLDAGCRAYEDAIAAAGGVDLQILGLGANGHIGFNEPGSSFGSRTRVETLAARTRADNARFFDDSREVPTRSVTQGLATIMRARRIVLLATGSAKAGALAAAIEGPVTASCPGSILQFHPDVTVIVDEGAAGQLALTERYEVPVSS